MFDLSPEKLVALLAVGMVVLGPQRLPAAARSLATNLTRMRKLAHSLTDPIQSSLAEPREAVQGLVSEARSSIGLQAPQPGQPLWPSTTVDNLSLPRAGETPDAGRPIQPELN